MAQDQLLLSGVGAGVASTHEGVDAVALTLTTNFTSPDVEGETVLLGSTRSSYRVELVERDFAAQ